MKVVAILGVKKSAQILANQRTDITALNAVRLGIRSNVLVDTKNVKQIKN